MRLRLGEHIATTTYLILALALIGYVLLVTGVYMALDLVDRLLLHARLDAAPDAPRTVARKESRRAPEAQPKHR